MKNTDAGVAGYWVDIDGRSIIIARSFEEFADHFAFSTSHYSPPPPKPRAEDEGIHWRIVPMDTLVDGFNGPRTLRDTINSLGDDCIPIGATCVQSQE